MPKNEFDQYSETYEETVASSISFSGLPHSFFHESKSLMLKDLLQKHFGDKEDLSLLDFGCGVGDLHPYIAPLFSTITGVDTSPDSIKRAQKNNPENTYTSYDGQNLPFDTGTFDVALAVCVLHHVPQKQWSGFLANMRRVVAGGGLVCLIEHNPFNPATRLSVARCPFDADAVLLGASNMKRRLQSADLTDVSTQHFVFFPSNKPSLRAIEKRLHWLPVGAQYIASGTA